MQIVTSARVLPKLLMVTFKVAFVLFMVVGCVKQTSGPENRNLRVPDGFVIEEAVLPGMVTYPMFATLDNTGRLFVVESSGKTASTEDVLKNPTFLIRVLEDTDEDGVFNKSTVFADQLPYPMGGTFYEGSFYTATPPDLLKLTDLDGDGIADKREVILTGWTLSHNAATLSGPFLGPDGWMYLCDARRGFDILTKEGARLKGKTARIWRCRPDGSGLESVSGGGFDNTIELVFMPSGETIGTMTYFVDPQDGLRDALMHWVEGGVYPKQNPAIEEDRLTFTGELMPVMTKLSRVSHAGLMRYRSSSFGPDYNGNLFTAEFNTGRIMRHVVSPDSGTYSTETKPFMESEIPDFHPTDVLEDADGSLLFVNTGGWFIAGCPLSVVAKTDVHGGIFRIRRKSSSEVEDPWGKKLDLKKLSGEELVRLSTDSRHVVRDNVFDELIRRGTSSIPHLRSILASDSDEEIRSAAVFALYRVGDAAAMEAVVTALDDKSAMVRTSACRVAGLAKEKNAVEKLLSLVRADEPQVRRQAATALGQIGEEKAISALLDAAQDDNDRFVEHAIIYSLIGLGESRPLADALHHTSETVQKTALTALDQMNGSPLTKDQLRPLLRSQSSGLRMSAMWALEHHPEWGDLAVDVFREYLEKGGRSPSELNSVTDLMVRFSRDKDVRQLIAERLNSAGVKPENKFVVLDIMSRGSGEEFPMIWINALKKIFEQRNPQLLSKALDVAVSRQITGIQNAMIGLASDPAVPSALRLKALGARLASQPRLSDGEFGMLMEFLKTSGESTIQQAASRLLVLAELNDEQLISIARDHIPTCDIFLLSGLVSAFEGSQSDKAGMALVTALGTSEKDRLDNLSFPEVERIIHTFSPGVEDNASALMAILKARQAARLSELTTIEGSLVEGDVGTGRALFYGKALCSTCHAIAGNGGSFGPDLSNIGEIRSRHDILEAIVYPGASFAREYETSRISTATNSYTGIVKDHMTESILVATGPGSELRIPARDITGIEPQNVSLMPSGLHKQLSATELSDLMTFLGSLPDGLGHLKKVANK